MDVGCLMVERLLCAKVLVGQYDSMGDPCVLLWGYGVYLKYALSPTFPF